jgi:hypothetical protein
MISTNGHKGEMSAAPASMSRRRNVSGGTSGVKIAPITGYVPPRGGNGGVLKLGDRMRMGEVNGRCRGLSLSARSGVFSPSTALPVLAESSCFTPVRLRSLYSPSSTSSLAWKAPSRSRVSLLNVLVGAIRGSLLRDVPWCALVIFDWRRALVARAQRFIAGRRRKSI